VSDALVSINIDPLREAILATWGRGAIRSRSVDVAIVQLAAGMAFEVDGLVGHRTLAWVRTLLAGNWCHTSGFTPPGVQMRPGVVRDAMEATYRRLDALLGVDRDLHLGLVQVVLGLGVTGLMGDPTRERVEAFLVEHWIYPWAPVPGAA
jgi:hypothetical protein